MLEKLDQFSFNHSDQIDRLYEVMTTSQMKQLFDSRGEELRIKLNKLVDDLQAEVGASNIGMTPIVQLGTQNKVKDIINRIIEILKSTVDGSSGADFISATSIAGLEGVTVQALLESLKKFVDDYKNELNSNTGASKVKTTSGKTVQEEINRVEGLANSSVTTSNEAKDIANTANNRVNNIVSSTPANKDAELVDMRFDALNNKTYTTAGKRIDDITWQLAENTQQISDLEGSKADKTEVNSLATAKADKTTTDDLQLNKAEKTETASLQSQINAITLQGTSGDSSAEVAQARIDTYGDTFPTVKGHLDSVGNIMLNGVKKIPIAWEYGTIAGGKYYESTVKMRNTTYLKVNTDITVDLVVPVGYTLVVWNFTKSGETYTAVGANNKTNSSRLILQATYYYRFVLSADDASTVTQSHCDAVVFSYSVSSNSKSFTTSRVPVLQNSIVSKNLELMLDWEYGIISGSGVLYNNEFALRTKGYIHFDNDLNVTVKVPSGYTVKLWAYTYNGSYSYSGLVTGDADYTATLLSNLHYKIGLAKVDGTFVDMSIANSVKIIGDKNLDMVNSFRNVENSLVDKSLNLTLRWENGTIAGAGVLYDSSTDMRTSDYIHHNVDATVLVTVPTGFNLVAWSHSYSNGTYSAVTTTIITGTGYLLLASRYHYKFVLKKTGATNATLSYCKQVSLAYLDTNKSNYATVFRSKEDEIVDKVINSISEDDVVFGLITDNHVGVANWDNVYKHGVTLNKICERVGSDFTINLGDTFTNSADEATNKKRLNDYLQYYRESCIPSMYCKGNHEVWNDMGDGLTGVSDSFVNAVNRSNKHIVKSSTTKLYYYFDVRNIRFVVLDSSSNGNNGFSVEQADFLTNAFTTLPVGMKVIVFTHIPLDASLMLQVTPTNADSIKTILQNNSTKVIAVMHGHTHWDNVATLNDIKYISTCCAMPGKQDVSTYTGLGTPTSYDRVYGDYTEYCFDIVTVNSSTGVIKTFRFGAGNDRTI